MDIKLRYKEGKAMAVTETGEARIIKLVLKDEFLEIMEKINPSKLDDVSKIQQIVSKQKLATESSFAYSKLPVERTVDIILNDNNSSLGISVKGGTDFNLPILISRIIPGEAADRTNELFVGDVILVLNGRSMLSCTHKDAVNALLSAGSRIVIQVRHLPHAATILLNEDLFKREINADEDSLDEHCTRSSRERSLSQHHESPHMHNNIDRPSSTENINRLPPEEYSYLINNSGRRKTKSDSKNWVIGLRISLQYANLSVFQYQESCSLEKLNSFLVRTVEGHSTGIISFKDPDQFHYWKEAIKFNINSLLIRNIRKCNLSSSVENQVHYMGWLYFAGEYSGELNRECHSYHESEYANVDTLPGGGATVVSGTHRNESMQCIARKQKVLHSTPSSMWCSIGQPRPHKSQQTTPVKTKVNTHPRNVLPLDGVSRHKKYYAIDKSLFIILRGIHIFMFTKPPTVIGQWFNPLKQYLMSRSMLVRSKKALELGTTIDMGEETHVPGASSVSGSVTTQNHINNNNHFRGKESSAVHFALKIELTEYECVADSLADMLELEKIWIRVNYYAVCQMKVDSFKCSYQNIDCVLCLDFDYGLKLINAADGVKIWQYQFHQLKASSDDGDNRLRLMFSDQIDTTSRIDQVLHCHRLGTLLISIQSFLTAKLGQVDPHYFDN